MNDFVIEDGVPVPSEPAAKGHSHGRSTGLTNALRQMNVGQSILVRDGFFSGLPNIYRAAAKASKKIAIRRVEGGVRVWCVEGGAA